MTGPLFRLGQRMASRNNLNAFAWICALGLPAGLQWITSVQEDVRQYVDVYYGPFTLYFFFVMTYGFATVFVSYYQLAGYRRAGTLDTLRITQTTPHEVLRDVYLQLQRILLPPILGFAVIFTVYLLSWQDREQILGLGGLTLAGGVLNVVLTEMLLCAILCLGLLRGEAALALLGMVLILPLNTLPIIVLFAAQRQRAEWEQLSAQFPQQYVQDSPNLIELWFIHAPWLFYAVGVIFIIWVLLWRAQGRLELLWPAQVRPLKGA